jgi:hypothetical protein
MAQSSPIDPLLIFSNADAIEHYYSGGGAAVYLNPDQYMNVGMGSRLTELQFLTSSQQNYRDMISINEIQLGLPITVT